MGFPSCAAADNLGQLLSGQLVELLHRGCIRHGEVIRIGQMFARFAGLSKQPGCNLSSTLVSQLGDEPAFVTAYQLEAIISAQIVIAKLNTTGIPLERLGQVFLGRAVASRRAHRGRVLHLAKSRMYLMDSVSIGRAGG